MIVYLLLSVFVSCGLPPSILYGYYNGNGDSAGSTQTLLCMHPYMTVRSRSYYCGRNGEWQGDGTCRKFVLLFIFSIYNGAEVLLDF